jgi:hypothetical protein
VRKVGGYLILSGIAGGFAGAMIYDLGLVPALCILGGAAVLLGMMWVAVELIMEAN